MLPHIEILIAFKTFIADGIAQLPEPARFTVRHARHRESTEEEWPCTAVRFVSNDIGGGANGDDSGVSLSEDVMEMLVDLVADAELPEEIDGSDDPSADPTGLAAPAAMIEAIMNMLFAAGSPEVTLDGRVWQIRHDGTIDSEDSTTEAARMVERLALLYRVRAEDHTVLLRGDD